MKHVMTPVTQATVMPVWQLYGIFESLRTQTVRFKFPGDWVISDLISCDYDGVGEMLNVTVIKEYVSHPLPLSFSFMLNWD